MEENSDYDLKIKEIDQIHSVTIEFSKTCLEIKKLFVGIIISLSLLILKLNGDVINANLFYSLLAATILFWVIDSQAYYYQIKIRNRMSKIMNEARRIKGLSEIDGVGMPVQSGKKISRVIASFLNGSQLLYIGVILINIIGIILM